MRVNSPFAVFVDSKGKLDLPALYREKAG